MEHLFKIADSIIEKVVEEEEKAKIVSEVLLDLPEWFGLPESTTPEIWKKFNIEWLYRRIIMSERKDRQKKLKIFAIKVIKQALGFS